MVAIALFTQAPRFCPGCGRAIDLLSNPYQATDWLAHCSHSCPDCGLHYQLVDDDAARVAATTSGGDLAQYV